MNANSSTKIADWLHNSTKRLGASGVDSARLDALLLLCDELGRDKAWVLAHNDDELTPVQMSILDEKLARRASHEPLAYIREKVEFYGRTLYTTSEVLVPRPESESIITLLLSIAARGLTSSSRVVDVGTGSGCLAITAKLELPDVEVVATDISAQALQVAQKNATALGAQVTFLQNDLLQPSEQILKVTANGDRLMANGHRSTVNGQWSMANGKWLILANLPYVPQNYPVNEPTTYEPDIALFSGVDGLDHYRIFFAQARALPNPPAVIITESLLNQHHALAELARRHGYALEKTQGIGQYFAEI